MKVKRDIDALKRSDVVLELEDVVVACRVRFNVVALHPCVDTAVTVTFSKR